MSRIRSRGNRDTELALVSFFRRHGITGWRVLRIWEHELAPRREAALVRKLRRALGEPALPSFL